MWLGKQSTRHALSAAVLLLTGMACAAGWAGPREQAKRIHDRLAGVPPSAAVLAEMTDKIEGGDAIGAAMQAMDNPAFYNTTLREFATPATNREQSIYADLNDSTATVIGTIRDDRPFDEILHEDVIYVGSAGATGTAYSHSDNAHYVDLQESRVNLGDPAVLERRVQSSIPGGDLNATQTAGIMTTRGFSEAFLVAGTNRAAVRFASINFLCLDMEDMRDVTAWPDRIRQDVTRSPGGDSAIFLNDCLSCHAGLDALAGAFAFYDFDEESQSLRYTPDSVQPKYLRDATTFVYGHETQGDSWVNYWRTGPNGHVGWNGPGSGMGAKSLGLELSQTRQFAECQVTKTFATACHRSPNGAADAQAIQQMADSFQANNRNMKMAFADAAVYCMGE